DRNQQDDVGLEDEDDDAASAGAGGGVFECFVADARHRLGVGDAVLAVEHGCQLVGGDGVCGRRVWVRLGVDQHGGLTVLAAVNAHPRHRCPGSGREVRQGGAGGG